MMPPIVAPQGDPIRPLIVAVLILALCLGAVMTWNYAHPWKQPEPLTLIRNNP